MKLIEFYKILYTIKTDLAYELDTHMKYTKYDGYVDENNFITFNKGGQVSFTNNDVRQFVIKIFRNQYHIRVTYVTSYDEWYKNQYLISIRYNKHLTFTFLLEIKYNRYYSIFLMNREKRILL